MRPYEINKIRYELMGRQQINGPGWLSRLARKAGWSPGTLAAFRNGTYHGNNELIAETLKAIFEGGRHSGGRGKPSPLPSPPQAWGETGGKTGSRIGVRDDGRGKRS